MVLPIKYNHQVDEKQMYLTPEEVIESLADLAGFTAYEVRDEMSSVIGYVLKENDKELQDFLAIEEAAEQHEAEIASCFDCYFEEEA